MYFKAVKKQSGTGLDWIHIDTLFGNFAYLHGLYTVVELYTNFVLIHFESQPKCAWTFQMLTVCYGESTMSRTQVQLWSNRFKKGREDVNEYARPDRPSMSTTDENIEAMQK